MPLSLLKVVDYKLKPPARQHSTDNASQQTSTAAMVMGWTQVKGRTGVDGRFGVRGPEVRSSLVCCFRLQQGCREGNF